MEHRHKTFFYFEANQLSVDIRKLGQWVGVKKAGTIDWCQKGGGYRLMPISFLICMYVSM